MAAQTAQELVRFARDASKWELAWNRRSDAGDKQPRIVVAVIEVA